MSFGPFDSIIGEFGKGDRFGAELLWQLFALEHLGLALLVQLHCCTLVANFFTADFSACICIANPPDAGTRLLLVKAARFFRLTFHFSPFSLAAFRLSSPICSRWLCRISQHELCRLCCLYLTDTV